MEKIAIIGCGLIGQGWAAVFAQAGFEVAMYDTSAEAARSRTASKKLWTMPSTFRKMVRKILI